MSNIGDVRVWWIPQIPGEPFYVPVESVKQGLWLCDVLADYDQFQLDNNIKGDYCNVGGVDVLEYMDEDGDPEWITFDPEWDEVPE